ncbi:MAG: M48 family metallopeptidase [candidate division Zixibacteria bacterium]|nr:M48 family metallopeptidase [candidate division Zixibacteria bacterium]
MKMILLSLFVLVTLNPIMIPAADLTNSAADSLSTSPRADTAVIAGADSAAQSNFIYPMPPERMAKLIAYSRFNNLWRFLDFFISVVILLIIIYGGLSARLRNWASKISSKNFFVYFFYFIFFMIVMYGLNFPFDYYRNFAIEHQYGFSNQTFGAWFGESLKSLGVGFVFGFILFLILYWLINRFRKWWLAFAIGSIPFMVLVIIIVPVIITPLFNKFEPIKNKELGAEMTALAGKAGIYNPDIYEVDASKQSSKVNAYFTGMFGTKRIVLYDTAIKNFTVNELKFIMGHEIGHYVMHHIWYGLFLGVVFIFIVFYLADKFLPPMIERRKNRIGFSRLGDIAGLPLLLLFVTVFSFIFQPIQNTASRYFENQSDRFGMQLSGVTGDEAATAFDKLSVFNLSDPEPSALIEFWFYTHPALKKRMDNVRKLYNELHPGV